MENRGIGKFALRGSDYLSGWVSPIPSEIILPDGDSKPFAAASELQRTKDGRDLMDCVAQAAANAIETLAKIKGIGMPKISRRAISVLSGTTKTGNSFQRVWDAIRTYGLIPESLCPDAGFADWEAYYGAVITNEARAAGLDALRVYDIGYEFIAYVSDATLREGLKRGPLQISIGDDGSGVETHSVALLNVKDGGSKDVLDSEIPGIATLPPGRRVYGALRPYLALKKNTTMKNVSNLEDRCLVTGFTAHGLVIGYYKAGKMIVDDPDELHRRWIFENEDNGRFYDGPVRTIPADQWETYEKVDLKGAPL